MDFKVNFDLGISKVSRDLARISDEISSMTKNVGKMVGAGIAVGIGMEISKGMIGAFKSVGRSMSGWLEDSMEFTAVNRKFDIVFGELRGKAQKFSEDFAKSINGSTTNSKAMMSRFQDTLVPIGFSRSKSMEMSMAMTQLATDLAASEPGITTGDAAARLQSALVGNHEAVRIFGVALAESSLKAKLLAMGIRGGTEKATEQEKALARLNIIIESTRDAHGSAARASADLRQQLGGFNAVFTEVSARMGNIFAPALAQVVSYFKDIGVVINASLNKSEEWGKSLGDAMKNILGLAGGLKDQIKDLSDGFATFVSSMSHGLVNATQDWGTFKASIGKLFDQAGVMLAPFFIELERRMLEGFFSLGGAVMALFNATGDNIKSTLSSIADMLYAIIRSIETAITKLRSFSNPQYLAASSLIESRVLGKDNRAKVMKDMMFDKVYKDERDKTGISFEAQIERRLQAQIRNELVALAKQFNIVEDTSASDAVKTAKNEINGVGKKAKTLGEAIVDLTSTMIEGAKSGKESFAGTEWEKDLLRRNEEANAAKAAAGEIKREVVAEEKAKSKGFDSSKIFSGIGGMIAGAVINPDAKRKRKERDESIWVDVANELRGEELQNYLSDGTLSPERLKENERRKKARNQRMDRADRAAAWREKRAANPPGTESSGSWWGDDMASWEARDAREESEKREKRFKGKAKYPRQFNALESSIVAKGFLDFGEQIKSFTAGLSSGGISGAINAIKPDKRSAEQIAIDQQSAALQKRIKALTHGSGVDFTSSEDLHKKMQTAISNPKEELELARNQLKRLEELKNEAPKTTQAINNLPGEIAKNLAKYIGYST